MKRSEINTILQSADEFIRGHGFYLPPFAYWTPNEWKTKGPEVSEIVENRLGWEISNGQDSSYSLCEMEAPKTGGPSRANCTPKKLWWYAPDKSLPCISIGRSLKTSLTAGEAI
jgi:hypothetical protein